MDLLQIIILALLQGITEFLPISSSAHLILPKELLGWPDQGLAFDVAVHFGSLLAVLLYFRKDVLQMIQAWFGHVSGKGVTPDSRLAWMIVVATIPAGLAGLIFSDFIEENLRSSLVIAATTIIFGLLLAVADRKKQLTNTIYDIGIASALIIGVAQAMALVPGTSRSGITITAALFLGICRSDAARFSFFMSIPIIVLSALFKTVEMLQEETILWVDIAIGTVVSGVSAYLCIHWFLKFIEAIGMMPFVIYRLVLGGVLIGMMWV
ncbi:undecaprenyl-diphosphate phosphatase [Marinibactrum halimedae]|uniref:Undecaprenyl-diphosphatase n=1 Tax=Marinibactrum halimedae TaxID=1444977 RepID=A0AA37WLZ1_9GAMM|nr:undecaprenyl-diphosphate phosphatase [Marinibactrum halimedae]MCD9458522.1 undecaprenyl-diphosphate phosphatase [Marinibactrum halimedae]GLS26614.1 undecaprenyl-diphosphatase [Marinibactrum halimedae]